MNAADIVTSIVDLIGSLIWPGVVLTIFLVLRNRADEKAPRRML